jgi:hypothetical protein
MAPRSAILLTVCALGASMALGADAARVAPVRPRRRARAAQPGCATRRLR